MVLSGHLDRARRPRAYSSSALDITRIAARVLGVRHSPRRPHSACRTGSRCSQREATARSIASSAASGRRVAVDQDGVPAVTEHALEGQDRFIGLIRTGPREKGEDRHEG